MGADKLRETASNDLLWEWEAMARDMAWNYPLATTEDLATVAVTIRKGPGEDGK